MVGRKHEYGSAHVIVITVLAVVIAGLLAFVFWQNFIQKKDTGPTATADTTTKSAGTSSATTDAEEAAANSIDTTKYVVIDAWNVKFVAPADGTGITWAASKYGSDEIGFSTSNLKTGELCNAENAAAGALRRSKTAYSSEGGVGTTIVPLNDSKPIDGYYYAFALPNGDHCDDKNPSDYDEVLRMQELVKTIVKA